MFIDYVGMMLDTGLSLFDARLALDLWSASLDMSAILGCDACVGVL